MGLTGVTGAVDGMWLGMLVSRTSGANGVRPLSTDLELVHEIRVAADKPKTSPYNAVLFIEFGSSSADGPLKPPNGYELSGRRPD
jgi:hypothetical protein